MRRDVCEHQFDLGGFPPYQMTFQKHWIDQTILRKKDVGLTIKKTSDQTLEIQTTSFEGV